MDGIHTSHLCQMSLRTGSNSKLCGLGVVQEQKFFDSADWQLQKQGVKLPEQPATPTGPLAPRLAPKQAPINLGTKGRRRASHLGDIEDE